MHFLLNNFCLCSGIGTGVLLREQDTMESNGIESFVESFPPRVLLELDEEEEKTGFEEVNAKLASESRLATENFKANRAILNFDLHFEK